MCCKLICSQFIANTFYIVTQYTHVFIGALQSMSCHVIHKILHFLLFHFLENGGPHPELFLNPPFDRWNQVKGERLTCLPRVAGLLSGRDTNLIKYSENGKTHTSFNRLAQNWEWLKYHQERNGLTNRGITLSNKKEMTSTSSNTTTLCMKDRPRGGGAWLAQSQEPWVWAPHWV